MAIKVHGAAMSTATLRVVATVNEKELEYEFVAVDMKSGAHKHPDFLALNPFGQVPALEDGDVKLFESRAITRYLAYAYENKGTPLLNKEGKHMAELAVWLEVEAHQFDPVASKLGWELVYKKMFGMETDAAVVEEQEAKLTKVLDVYEARLSKTKYLAGETFTLADLHHMPTLHFVMGTQVKKLFEERPHVCAWAKDILARPSWEKTLALQKQA